MRHLEALWIARQLAALPIGKYAPVLNVASSTAEFRQVRQPHIDTIVFAPLRAAGVEVIHADLKEAPGVDIAGDLQSFAMQERLRECRARTLLCCNLLEHVPNPGELARVLASLLSPGAILIVTAPHSYPYHPDPIDTGFRPTPTELASLFPDCTVLAAETITDVTYARELASQGWAGLRKGTRTLLGALRPFHPIGKAQRDRLKWLLKPFMVSCVTLRVDR